MREAHNYRNPITGWILLGLAGGLVAAWWWYASTLCPEGQKAVSTVTPGYVCVPK